MINLLNETHNLVTHFSKRYCSYNVGTPVYFIWNIINVVLIWAAFNQPIGTVAIVIVVILRNL